MSEQRNIIGESFRPYVREQIKIRQTKLANQNRDEEVLKYITSKTSWIRLSSGVNVTDEIARQVQVRDVDILNSENIILSGDLLAKAHVLKNFENQETNSTFKRYSISYNPLTNQGYIPLPGIISVDVKSLNKGSLREATVQITCHSITQFRIIEALYLRLKYSMLLEWGHSYWYDNNGNLRSDMPDEFHQEFLDGKYDQDQILENIEKNRRNYCGNYDAFLGYVKNFTWSIRQDGGYDITLNLISIGDIIESLKLNVNYPSDEASKIREQVVREIQKISSNKSNFELPSTVANKNKSTLNQILYAIQQLSFNRNPIQGYNDNNLYGLNAEGVVAITKAISLYDLKSYNYRDPIEFEKPNEASNILAVNEVESFLFPSLTPLNEEGESVNNPFSYIKLGALLRIIESFLLKYDISKTDDVYTDSYKPIFYIDHDYDTNLCLTLPQQFSVDPRVCLLRPAPNYYQFSQFKLLGTSLDNFLEKIDQGYGTFRPFSNSTKSSPFIGRFMHIPVNIDYITTVLNNNIDEEGKVSLYTFLNQLMKGIQTAIGSINNFEVTYDEITNYFIIRDNNIIPGAEELLKRENIISQINVNTLKSNAGSFVTDVSIKSELNNSFASIISIGAQANGNQVGENATALSKLNNGYTDRILTKKSSYIDYSLQNLEGEVTSSLGVNESWEQNIIDYGNILEKIDKGLISPDDISNATQNIVDLFKYELGYYTQQNNIGGTGFIPLNLQITMDGLSGPRIYEVYSINEDLLPESYKNNIQFITKGVSHKIDNNGWYTTLESFSGPKPQGTTLAPLESQTLGATQTNNPSTTDIKIAEENLAIENCSSIPSVNRQNVSDIQDKIREAGSFLIKEVGLSKEAAAGALGSLIAESRLNYQAWNGKGSKTEINGGVARTTITVGSIKGDKLDSYDPLKLTFNGQDIVAYGLPQWVGNRKIKYFAFQKQQGGDSFKTQLKYIKEELQGSYYKPLVLDKLKQIADVGNCGIWKASGIWLKNYEGVYTPDGHKKRYALALEAYKYL